MKKILLLAFMGIISSVVSAQTFYSNYYLSSGVANKPNIKFEVQLLETEAGDYVLLESYGSAVENYFKIPAENLDYLQNCLKYYKDKYVEWTAIAKKNKVQDMDKEMEYKFPQVGAAWFSNKWWFSEGFSYNIPPRYVVKGGKEYTFNFDQAVRSSNNEFAKSTISIICSCAADFDALINVLNPTKIEQKFNEMKSSKNLFK